MRTEYSQPVQVAQAPLNTFAGHRIKLSIENASSSTNQSEWPLSAGNASADKANTRDAQLGPPTSIKVNTDVTRHRGSSPEQVFPDSNVSKTDLTTGSNPKKLKGGRPPRLDLTKELSPFDRDIPIVLSVPLGSSRSKHEAPLKNDCDSHQNKELFVEQPPTPRILVTPIKDSSPSSQSQLKQRKRPKPASSVYTRAGSTFGNDPPSQKIPPLPKVKSSEHRAPTSPRTAASELSRLGRCPISPWWKCSNDESPSPQSAPEPLVTPSKASTSRSSIVSILPTPRRSCGWWNLLMSPVNVKRESTSSLIRSKSFPLVDEDAPEIPILNKAAPMAKAQPRGIDNGILVDPRNSRASGSAHPRASFDMKTPTSGEAAKYYDRNNYYGPENERDVDDEGDDEPVFSQVEQKETAKQATLKSPTTPAKINSVHGLLREDPCDVHERDSRVVVDNLSKFHEVISPQAATKDEAHPEENSKNVGVTNEKREEHPPDIIPKHNANKTPTIASEAFSPVVGLATVKHFQNARSVETKESNEKTPQPAPSDWPIRSDSREQSSQKAQSPVKSSESSQTPKPNLLFPAYRPTANHPKPKTYFVQTHSEHDKKKERNFLILVAATLIMILLLILILCMTIVRTHSDMAVEAQWINLGNLPPLPTGISTFSGPKMTSQSHCASDPDLWSCSLPKEQQVSSGSYSDLPSFRFEIRSSQDPPSSSTSRSKRVKRTASAIHSPNTLTKGRFSSAHLAIRDIFTDLTTSPDPASPSTADYRFLGNTTDHISQPFEGEKTPFTISFLPFANSNGTQLSRRDTSSNLTSNDLPKPQTESNGSAVPAQLYPLPLAQPLRLFDRGKDTEHYGFFTYFDKSIFMRYPVSNSSSLKPTSDPVNDNGGVERDQANVRCTWSQTRFHVQIWTQANSSSVMGSANSTATPNATSSALDNTAPGSFVLPTTITIDRHGGEPGKKGLYCDALDNDGKPIRGGAVAVAEDRTVVSPLISPAPGPFTAPKGSSTKQGGYDGGVGGCGCGYVNYTP